MEIEPEDLFMETLAAGEQLKAENGKYPSFVTLSNGNVSIETHYSINKVVMSKVQLTVEKEEDLLKYSELFNTFNQGGSYEVDLENEGRQFFSISLDTNYKGKTFATIKHIDGPFTEKFFTAIIDLYDSMKVPYSKTDFEVFNYKSMPTPDVNRINKTLTEFNEKHSHISYHIGSNRDNAHKVDLIHYNFSKADNFVNRVDTTIIFQDKDIEEQNKRFLDVINSYIDLGVDFSGEYEMSYKV